MRGVVVVSVARVGVGVGCEGFEVEFAGGGEDAGCYFASGGWWVSLMAIGWRGLRFVFLGESSG